MKNNKEDIRKFIYSIKLHFKKKREKNKEIINLNLIENFIILLIMLQKRVS